MGGRATSPFDRLKRRILREFPRKKLIGDIIISDDEYLLLKEYLQNIYKSISRGGLSTSADPMLAVALVQIGIRYYDANYWSHVAREANATLWYGSLGLNTNAYNELRNRFAITLKKYNKHLFGAGNTVQNILYHGMVSDHYTDDFFDFLFAFYRIDLNRDLQQLDREKMRNLLQVMQRRDNTERTYQLVSHTADAIISNPAGCRSRIRWLLWLMDRCFWEGTVPFRPVKRLTRRFFEWKEQSEDFRIEYEKCHSGGLNVRGEKYFSAPRLKCDFRAAIPAINIVFAPQIIRIDDLENPGDVYWRVQCGRAVRTIKVALTQAVTGYRTQEAQLPIDDDAVFSRHDIDLLCGSRKIRHFRIHGDCVRFFDRGGNFVHARLLPEGEMYALTAFNDLVVSEAADASERRGSFTLTHFDFQIGDIVRLPDGNLVSVGKKAEEGLIPRYRVHGTCALKEDRRIPVYKKPPSLFIKMQPAQSPGTAVVVNGKVHKFLDTATVFTLHDRSGDSEYVINLIEYGCKEDGLYEIYIDIPRDRSRRYWEFALIDGFSFEFEDAPYVFAPRGTLRLPDFLNISALDDEKTPGENGINFTINAQSDYKEATVHTKNASIIVQFDLPVFRWKFDEGAWRIDRPPALWHGDFPTYLYLKYPCESIKIRMDDPSQSVGYRKRISTGCFSCDLTRFKSWFNREQSCQRMFIGLPDSEVEFATIITRSTVTSSVITGDYDRGVLLGSFEITGKAEYYADIYYGEKLIADKAPIRSGRLEIPCQLESGKYSITVFERESNETGFDFGNYEKIAQLEQELMNPNDLSGACLELLSIREIKTNALAKPLRARYMVTNLRQRDHIDRCIYDGRMISINFSGQQSYLAEVCVDFYHLDKPNYCYIFLPDGEEEMEFLYDEKTNLLVVEENRSLPRSVRYRRYTSIYPEDYVYEVNTTDRAYSHKIDWYGEVGYTRNERRFREKEKVVFISEYKNKFGVSIDKLNLSERTYNCLKKADIHFVGDIIRVPLSALLKIRNLGKQGVDEVRMRLSAMGIKI